MRCKEAIFIGSTWSKWLPIDVATASHQENVLTIINLKTPEGIYGDWTFEQVIGSPIDQENNNGDKSSNSQVAKRWTCKDNMTEKLIEMILSYKSSEKYEGVDLESVKCIVTLGKWWRSCTLLQILDLLSQVIKKKQKIFNPQQLRKYKIEIQSMKQIKEEG